MDKHLESGLLGDYAEGLLDAQARAAADAHLEACPDCRAELASVAAYFREMSGLQTIPAPADFLAKVRARLPQEPAWRRALSAVLRPLRVVPLQIALGGLIGITCFSIYMRQGDPEFRARVVDTAIDAEAPAEKSAALPAQPAAAVPASPSLQDKSMPIATPRADADADAEKETRERGEDAKVSRHQASKAVGGSQEGYADALKGAGASGIRDQAASIGAKRSAPGAASPAAPALDEATAVDGNSGALGSAQPSPSAASSGNSSASAPAPASPMAAGKADARRLEAPAVKPSVAREPTPSPAPADRPLSRNVAAAKEAKVHSTESMEAAAPASRPVAGLTSKDSRPKRESQDAELSKSNQDMSDDAGRQEPEMLELGESERDESRQAVKKRASPASAAEPAPAPVPAKAKTAEALPGYELHLRARKDTLALWSGLKAMGVVVSPQGGDRYTITAPASMLPEIHPYLMRYGTVEVTGSAPAAGPSGSATLRLRILPPPR